MSTKPLLALVMLSCLTAASVFAQVPRVVNLYRTNGQVIPRDRLEHKVQWQKAAFDDIGAWKPTVDTFAIITPPGISRMRCHAHVELQETGSLPLHHVVLRMIIDGGHFGRLLPESIGLRRDGLWYTDSLTPWFAIFAGRRISVTIEANGGEDDPFVIAESFFECEIVTGTIMRDGFETGDVSAWGNTQRNGEMP